MPDVNRGGVFPIDRGSYSPAAPRERVDDASAAWAGLNAARLQVATIAVRIEVIDFMLPSLALAATRDVALTGAADAASITRANLPGSLSLSYWPRLQPRRAVITDFAIAAERAGNQCVENRKVARKFAESIAGSFCYRRAA
jgi:hypothetical protein